MKPSSKQHQEALERMITGWREYAAAHNTAFDSPIGEDYVLGPAWKQIGEALLTLLNGETGALDCGHVDGLIRRSAATHHAEIDE